MPLCPPPPLPLVLSLSVCFTLSLSPHFFQVLWSHTHVDVDQQFGNSLLRDRRIPSCLLAGQESAFIRMDLDVAPRHEGQSGKCLWKDQGKGNKPFCAFQSLCRWSEAGWLPKKCYYGA